MLKKFYIVEKFGKPSDVSLRGGWFLHDVYEKKKIFQSMLINLIDFIKLVYLLRLKRRGLYII